MAEIIKLRENNPVWYYIFKSCAGTKKHALLKFVLAILYKSRRI